MSNISAHTFKRVTLHISCLTLAAIESSAHAVTFYADQTGQWTSATTWQGDVFPSPATNDKIELRGSSGATYTITFDPASDTPSGSQSYDYSSAFLDIRGSTLNVNSGSLSFSRVDSSFGGVLNVTGGTLTAASQANPRFAMSLSGGTYEILGATNFKDNNMSQSGGLFKLSQWTPFGEGGDLFLFSGGVVQVSSDTAFDPEDFNFVDDSTGILKVKSDNAAIFASLIGDGSIEKDLSDVFVFGSEDIGGETYQTLSVAVPEPGAMTLLAIGSLLVVARRR